MIELKIEGVCKGCIFQELTLIAWAGNVRCKHDEVCKFIGDPDGKEKYNATVKLMREKAVEELEERNEDDD